MIEAVGAWVKGIVFIVLFAAFLELLLPSGGMQKFVRVIMGLLIMTAVLNPVLDLADKNPGGAQTAVFGSGQGNDYDYPSAGITAASAANAAREKRERLAKEYYVRDLARQIRATALSVGGVADAEVTVSLKEDAKAGTENASPRVPVPQVARVTILVKPENTVSSQAVKAVKITGGASAIDKNFSEKFADSPAKKTLNPLVKEKIERAVSELYHISLGNIVVQPSFADER